MHLVGDRDDPMSLVLDLVVVVGFAVAGCLLAGLPQQARNGGLLIVTAVLLLLADLSVVGSSFPASFQIAFVAGPLPYVPLAALLLRWPGQQLGVRARRFVALLLGVLPGGRLLDAVLWDPAWTDYRGRVWWLYLGTPRWLHDRLVVPLVHGSAALAAVVALALLVVHWRAQRRLDRVELLPLLAAAMAVALTAGSSEAVWVVPERLVPSATLDLVASWSLLLVPLSFIAVALTHRLARGQVAGAVVQIGAGSDVVPVLREALDDPALQVLYAVDGLLVGADGRSALPDPGRLPLPVRDRDGSDLAVLVVDPRLARHQELLQATVAAAGLAIANTRLRLAAQSQLAEVRASRQRIAESGLEARRQLERDLHDGAQQRLLAVSAGMSRAKLADGPEVVAVLDQTQQELRLAIAELRDLARGLHPALLSQAGLRAALSEVAAHAPVETRTDLDPGRWSPAVEATAYFLVCEALTNIAKHAQATSASICVRERDGALVVQVQDDGRGGADPGGHGLRGLHDRVTALDGHLTVSSPPLGGTTLTATLPCG
jgi:signal transduction histidine kinase